MKKLFSILIVAVFVCASFFVFTTEVGAVAGTPGDDDTPALTPIFTFGPIITPFTLAVEFPDPNLDAAMHDRTGVPPGDNIHFFDLSALTGNLVLNDLDITNLSGLQFCPNITGLYLEHNNISALMPDPNGLASLEHLSFADNNFTTIPSELCGIPNLKSVTFSGNPVSSVAADLGCMPQLESLRLIDCAFTSFPTQLISNHITFLDLAATISDRCPSISAL